jgi:dihydrofolate reductase
MRQVIWQIDITLDSFVAGPKGETDWVTADEQMNQDAYRLLCTVDTILLARVAYQDFAQYWPFADTHAESTIGQIALLINQATKVIFSRTLNTVAWGQWNNAKLINGDIDQAIRAMKEQPGKHLLLYAGADIASAFIRHGLVDDYRLRIHPVVVGVGNHYLRTCRPGFRSRWCKRHPTRMASFSYTISQAMSEPFSVGGSTLTARNGGIRVSVVTHSGSHT